MGERVGDYEILGKLGAGGMGQVLKVRNVITDRVEAMKVLLPNLAGRQELVDRFLREIKVLAGLEHPNIAALRTAFTYNDRLVMVMEFVEGHTIAEILAGGPLAVKDAVNYVDQVLQALSYAHSRNVIHRDIKPANIMLTPQGVVKLMDFGIARSQQDRSLTQTGTTLGSLFYMSPEQVRGEDIDARADLYSLGVSLYEMLTGTRPFQDASDFSIMNAHLMQAPQPPIELRPDLPPALNQIVLMSLSKDRNERFQTAEAFRNALKSVAVDAPAAAISAPVAVPQAPSRTQAMAVAAGSATAVLQGAAPASAPAVTASALAAQSTYFPGVETSTNRRGLWVAIGGLLVLGVLVASAIYVPRRTHTEASAQSAPAAGAPPSTPAPSTSASTTSAPAAPDIAAASQPAAQPEAAVASATRSATPSSAEANNLKPAASAARPRSIASATRTATTSTSLPSPAASQPTAEPQPSAPTAAPANSAALGEVEHDFDLLSSRAASINESLSNLRRQQAAQGLGLRGDISATHDRMATALDRTQAALRQHDAEAARKYLVQAEAEVERLEKFLGR